MKLDFYHNKIVSDVISEEFEICFSRELTSLLSAKYGEIEAVQMYEDYISDNFLLNGYWYYPFTLVIGGEIKTQWIRWQINKTDFDDGIPYAFSGRGKVGFELCDGPREFEERIVGRSRYYPGGSVGVRIEIVKGDSYRLSGRYSQTFIDEMARQLTPAIEAATGVTGIADSSVELVMVFASGTYMEHISENVTYRRLMLVDKVSAPRDFWIKWTRLDGAVAHPISAHVSAENILFELGEDVEQKIREKEYRYLLSSGKEKYHNSMGRKKVTEWREVIKRAARRGELSKIEPDYELVPETIALGERIADLLGKRKGEETKPEREEVPCISDDKPESDEYARAMEKMRMVVEGDGEDESEPLTLSEITEEISASESEDEPLVITDIESDEQIVEFEDEADEESLELELDDESFELDEEEAIDNEADDYDEAEEEVEAAELDIFADEEPKDEEIDIFAEDPDDESEDEEYEESADEEFAEELVIEENAEEITEEAIEEAIEETIEEAGEEEIDESVAETGEEFVIGEIPEDIFEGLSEEPDEELVIEAAESENEEDVSKEIAEDEADEEDLDEEPAEEFVIEEKPTEESADVEEVTEDQAEEIACEEASVVTEDLVSKEEALPSVSNEIAPENKPQPTSDSVAEPGIAERVADIRAEIETKIRLEYEIRAREKVERELIELRQKLQATVTESELTVAELKNENARLRREYDRLLEQIESERFARESEEARRRIEEKQLREEIEKQLRAEAAERERLAESARVAIEEQRRLEEENARISREREEAARAEAERIRMEEEARAEAERIRREEHERELEAIRQAEAERIRREQQEAQARGEAVISNMGDGKYTYSSKVLKLVFTRNVDPNITTRIQQLIKATVDYYDKDTVSLKIRASIPDQHTVLLEFVDIPMEEMPLLGNIIKVLGGAGLGISKAILN